MGRGDFLMIHTKKRILSFNQIFAREDFKWLNP